MRYDPAILIVYLVSIALAFYLGMAVILKKRNYINLLFLMYIATLIFWIVSNFLSDALIDHNAALTWAKLSIIGPLMVVPTFLRISQLFPEGKGNSNKDLLIWLPPLALMCFTPTSWNVKDVILHDWGAEFVPGLLYIPSTFIFVLYIGIAIKNLLNKLNTATLAQKQQIKFIIAGAFTTLSVSILVSAILPLLGYSRLAFIAPATTLFLFGAIAYAIIKHSFLDINAFVFRTITFAIIATIIGVFYSFALFALPSTLTFMSTQSIILLSSVLITLTFNPLRRLIETITKDIFFKSPYSSDELLEECGDIIRSTLSIDRLAKNILKALTGTLKLDYGCFIITNGSDVPTTFHLGKKLPISITQNYLHNLIATSENKLIIFDEIVESPIKILMREVKAEALLPLTIKSNTLGVVLLGQKISGDDFTTQDIEIFNILLPQLAIAVQNAKSYEEISQFNITLKDEIAKATLELRKANRNLKHLDKIKDEFVFIATHELKNPVTAMRGYISMFQEGIFGEIPDKMKAPMSQLQASNQQLVELVNDLLQIARSEAKTLTVNTEPVELCPIIDTVKESVRPLANQKSLEIIHTCPTNLSKVQADVQRVKEIINNLLSNAIKYSEKGTITVSHETTPTSLITHVKDEGVGISAADQQKLFTRFYRVEEEAAKGIPGTGLGLFIVKQLIEKMGGKIWVNSEKGIGSTFSFSLPKA